MRNLFKIATIVLLVGFSFTASAQKLKFGHIDTQKILSVMPERDSAEAVLQKEAADLQEQMELMQVEYNKKLEVYKTQSETWTKLVKQDKELELQDMQERIQSFQAQAQQELQKRETELLKPIYDKFQNAIEEVSKENGFSHVFDVNTMLYVSEASTDISDMVKAKLGMQ